MRKIAYVLLVLLLSVGMISCGNSKKSNLESKQYSVGEGAMVTDSKGKEVYSLQINGVKIADDFEYEGDYSENTQQIVEVDYTYKNIAKDDEVGLKIHGADLQVIDSKGFIAESSSMFPKQQPQSIMPGVKCTVQAYYGLPNKSDKVKIIFKSEMYNSVVNFEIPVQ